MRHHQQCVKLKSFHSEAGLNKSFDAATALSYRAVLRKETVDHVMDVRGVRTDPARLSALLYAL